MSVRGFGSLGLAGGCGALDCGFRRNDGEGGWVSLGYGGSCDYGRGLVLSFWDGLGLLRVWIPPFGRNDIIGGRSE